FVRKVIGLLDRQRIHVGAQADGLAVLSLFSTNDADNTGAPKAGHNFVAAEGLELVRNGRSGAMHGVHQFRVHMQIAPPLGDFPMKIGNAVYNRHGSLRSARRSDTLANIGCWGLRMASPIDRAGGRPYTARKRLIPKRLSSTQRGRSPIWIDHAPGD